MKTESTTNSHLHLVQCDEQPPTAGYPEHEGRGWELLLLTMQERSSQTATNKVTTPSNINISRAA